MAESRTMRLNKVLRELNISLDRAVEYLAKNGHEIEARPTTKISGQVYQVLLDGFETDANKRAASKEIGEEKRKEKEAIRLELEAKQERKRAEEERKEEVLRAKADKLELKTVGKIDIDPAPAKKDPEPKAEPKPVVETPAVEEPKKEAVEEPKKEIVEEPKKEVVEKSKPEETQKPAAEESKPEETNQGTIKTKYKKLDGPKLTGKKIDLKQFEKAKKKPEEKTGSRNPAASPQQAYRLP